MIKIFTKIFFIIFLFGALFFLNTLNSYACCCENDCTDNNPPGGPSCCNCILPCGGLTGGGGGGGGGWTACTGCGGDHPVGNVSSLTVTRISPTDADLSWSGGGGCSNYGYVLFVGTDARALGTNCWHCGADYPGNGGFAGSHCTDKDAPSTAPGCLAQRVFSSGVKNVSLSTAGITLQPNTTYYVKVVTNVSYKDANDENVENDCGGVTQSFLGTCSSTVSKPLDNLGIGDTVTFTTPIDQNANTTDSYTPKVSTVYPKQCAQPPDPECTMMCQATYYYPCGAIIAGWNFGSGQDHVVLNVNGHHYEGDNDITNVSYIGGDRITVTDSQLFAQGFVYNDLGCLSNHTCGDAWTSGATISYLPSTIQPPAQYNIDHVSYTGDPAYISFNPTEDFAYPYESIMTALASTYPGTTTATTSVWPANISTSTPACTDTTAVTIGGSRDPWWQVIDSDLQADSGLSSSVPASNFFDLPGGGGYPGVPAYGSSTDLATTNVSETGWIAQSTLKNPKTFDYQYFANQIPSGTTINSIDHLDQSVIDGATEDPSTGYYWLKYDGSSTGLSLDVNSAIDVGDKKVILFIDSANLNLNSGASIALTDGSGFFLAIVGQDATLQKGNITLQPDVTSLEGLYLADGTFTDGATGSQDDVALHVRGSVVAYSGATLQRDLGSNNSFPGEVFEYAPDQIALFPTKLAFRKINWKEVAP